MGPRLHEDVLHGLLDVADVLENAPDDDPKGLLVAADDLRERLHLAALRGMHELGVIRGLLPHAMIVDPQLPGAGPPVRVHI